MSVRRACCRHTYFDPDKGPVPNRSCQPRADLCRCVDSLLRLCCDENRLRDLKHFLRSWRNVHNLGDRKDVGAGARSFARADVSPDFRLEHNGLRKTGWQALGVNNASYSWNTIAQEYVSLYRKLEIQSERKDR